MGTCQATGPQAARLPTIGLLVLAATFVMPHAAVAQQAAPPATGESQSTLELAKKTQNPIADLISLPLQNNLNFGYGAKDAPKPSSSRLCSRGRAGPRAEPTQALSPPVTEGGRNGGLAAAPERVPTRADERHPGDPVEGRSSMSSNSQRVKRAFGGLLLLSAIACFGAAGCSEIQPAPNVEGAGDLQSPTHEQDALHEDEQHEEGRGRR